MLSKKIDSYSLFFSSKNPYQIRRHRTHDIYKIHRLKHKLPVCQRHMTNQFAIAKCKITRLHLLTVMKRRFVWMTCTLKYVTNAQNDKRRCNFSFRDYVLHICIFLCAQFTSSSISVLTNFNTF